MAGVDTSKAVSRIREKIFKVLFHPKNMVQAEHRRRLGIVPNTALHPISEVGIGYLVGGATAGHHRRPILESKRKLLRLSKEEIPDPKVGSGQANSLDGAKLDSIFESRIAVAPFRRV
jgi:hypothetical protein